MKCSQNIGHTWPGRHCKGDGGKGKGSSSIKSIMVMVINTLYLPVFVISRFTVVPMALKYDSQFWLTRTLTWGKNCYNMEAATLTLHKYSNIVIST